MLVDKFADSLLGSLFVILCGFEARLLTAELMSKTSRNFLTASGVPFAELGADEVAQLEEVMPR